MKMAVSSVLLRVVWQFSDVSEVVTAAIIQAMVEATRRMSVRM